MVVLSAAQGKTSKPVMSGSYAFFRNAIQPAPVLQAVYTAAVARKSADAMAAEATALHRKLEDMRAANEAAQEKARCWVPFATPRCCCTLLLSQCAVPLQCCAPHTYQRIKWLRL